MLLLETELRSRTVPLATVAPNEGYLETAWFDAETRAAARASAGRRPMVVKVRVFADPTGAGTRAVVFVEAVTRFAWDPSVPERELERMVPEGHPARSLLTEIMAALPRVAPPSPPRQ